VNATAVDYARFGLAFLHGGVWGGRIVSEEWVQDATAVDTNADPADRYQYFWWSTRSARDASTRSETSVSTSTWPPIRGRSSSEPQATGGSRTMPGWTSFGTWQTGSRIPERTARTYSEWTFKTTWRLAGTVGTGWLDRSAAARRSVPELLAVHDAEMPQLA